ncbi:MAG: hypothetical protein ABI462_13825, partial [Ignavibacteria bacterium]
MKIFIVIIICVALFLSESALAQMQFDWARVYNGAYSGGAEDVARAIVLDNKGNSYVTGAS